MRVHELISILQNAPPDAFVVMQSCDGVTSVQAYPEEVIPLTRDNSTFLVKDTTLAANIAALPSSPAVLLVADDA
jgi:hypothetical protein